MNQLLLALIASAALQFQGHERILHLSCGQGMETAELAQQVPDGFVMGIDPSEEAVAAAEMRYDLDLLANLQFGCVDLETMPFDGQFDFVHGELEASLDALKAVAKSLKSGGMASLSFPPSEELEALLSEAGLTVLSWESVDGRIHVKAKG